MAAHHEVWSIITEDGLVASWEDRAMATYGSPEAAYAAVAKIKENHPDRDLTVKKSRLTLPWRTW